MYCYLIGTFRDQAVLDSAMTKRSNELFLRMLSIVSGGLVRKRNRKLKPVKHNIALSVRWDTTRKPASQT